MNNKKTVPHQVGRSSPLLGDIWFGKKSGYSISQLSDGYQIRITDGNILEDTTEPDDEFLLCECEICRL